MPTTTFTDAALDAFAIGARTDESGAPVDDGGADEARLVLEFFSEGVMSADSWQVRPRQAGANMSVDIGSGVAHSDVALVKGQAAGQGKYMVRLSAVLLNVAVPAAHLTSARIDQMFLVIADAPYDGGSVSLPRIGYRQGDTDGGEPGPDPAWNAYLPLATINVAAGMTAVTDAAISDQRTFSRSLVAHTPGEITAFAGSAAPAGALMCNGQAVSRTTYARLFATIGTAFGAGNGSTTFNVPNLLQRFPLGKAASGTGSILGSTGGVIDHSHLTDPPLTTSTTAGAHVHTVDPPNTNTTTALSSAFGYSFSSGTNGHDHQVDIPPFNSGSVGDHAHNVNIAQTASTVNNPPFQVVNYIVWV